MKVNNTIKNINYFLLTSFMSHSALILFLLSPLIENEQPLSYSQSILNGCHALISVALTSVH